jgi:hypothetical protein
MKKEWIKKSDFVYTYWVDEKQAGEMNIQFSSLNSIANCNINGKIYVIKRTGFWKSNLEITGPGGAPVLKSYPEKWYASSFILEFNNKIYKLVIRNNPLAEYALTENGNDVLAYGLDTTNRQLKIRITTPGEADPLFDFLLWYLFLPVANENLAGNYSFLLRAS